MALFQKKPQVASSAPAYTIGNNKTVLIIGLGNPGDKYDQTRHNVGFIVLDDFAQKNEFEPWSKNKDIGCYVSINKLGQARVILCKPTMLMNNSGQAAKAIQKFYKLYNRDTLAVYDELAIPLGSLRTRVGGSDAGHNGVKSLVQHLGEGFGRLRIGIGSSRAIPQDSAKFVLAKFTKEEQVVLPLIIQEANAMLVEYIFGGELPHDTRTIL